MARKRYSDEDVLNLLRQIELSVASGSSVETACRSAGISDATYYNWRKKYGGMGKSQLQELKGLEKENTRLKRIVADLELDKLILKESLDYLKPKCQLRLKISHFCRSKISHFERAVVPPDAVFGGTDLVEL